MMTDKFMTDLQKDPSNTDKPSTASMPFTILNASRAMILGWELGQFTLKRHHSPSATLK